MNAKRKITAEAKSVGEILLGPVTYRVPLNQRDFAWLPDDQVTVLWEDLTAALDEGRDEYFLGAIVIAPGEGAHEFEIVDGQQRITALSMIFAAIRDKWGEDDRASEVSSLYLGNKDRKSREIIPKITLNETNNPVYKGEILDRATSPAGLLRYKSNQLLLAAFSKIRLKLDDWCKSHSSLEDALIALEGFIAEHTKIIVIQVGDESDAFIIFETLNDRGLDLAVSDLVKNYLFSQAGSHLSQFKTAWSTITAAVGSENMTAFLRHYWLSEHELLRERELYRKLRDSIKGATKPRAFVTKLQNSAEHYAALTSPDHPFWANIPGEPQRYIRTLRLLRATQFRPLALAVMDGGSGAEIMSMLRIVLVISLRYIIAGSSANALEQAYSDAAVSIRKSGKRNAKNVSNSIRTVYVGDTDFKSAFSQYGFSKADLARFILAELNRQLELDGAIAVAEDATLEHVMPRSPGIGWTNVPPPDELSNWVEKIGNLTILERASNRGLGNKSFPEKRKVFTSSKLALNVDLAARETWDTDAITARSMVLAEIAAKIWRLAN